MRNTCTVEECREDVVGRGLCRKHYMRWQRWGNPEEPDHRSMRDRNRCSVEGCDEQAHGSGLCSTHYRQRARDDDPEVGPFQRSCEWCETEFLGRYKDRSRFCSRACAQRARNQTPEQKQRNLDRYYLRRYGITKDEAAGLKAAGCDICGRTEVSGRWENNLHIDHDHETGKIRGVLCHGCNVSLGHFNDDPELLAKAIAYLA